MLRLNGNAKKQNNRKVGKGGLVPVALLALQCCVAGILMLAAPALQAQDLSSSQVQAGQEDPHPEDGFLILQTNVHPPYQELQNGTLSGFSVSILDCVFDRLDVGYGLAIAPRQRNREMVRTGKADGFFLARISEEMDAYAVATNPLALEKWVWVSSSGKSNDPRIMRPPKPGDFSTVGAILGSNEAEWLEETAYEDVARVPSIASLVSQVATGRVDYALVDKHSFEIARKELGLTADKFLVQFERYAPLVVYLSKQYVAEFPEMLEQLNAVLQFCETRPMRLEPWERSAIERVQLPVVHQFARSPELLARVQRLLDEAESPSEEKKRLKDVVWAEMARKGEKSKTANKILENELSEHLRMFQANKGEQIAEAFIFDVHGQIIGMSRLTSDFDQSDEPQFQMIESINRDQVLITDILFDASTRAFLSQITVPIIDPDSGQTLAALTVGLNVSAALRPES
ncbi:transporter substrate-binding domain-containing protein [Thalassospira sp. HF15]|uniref:transporter substrate-binding domain-containing protein n=1 Tax=Thalassospira sp. HF15 TaxID=2722755 RepID=UPI001430A638|nr:transporter substrate-binding domain-containing protein [Thalassospira sp. HF15]NIY76518.1 transporter substrate-binding domain-containing protein [Thalassospira sp. HF15]